MRAIFKYTLYERCIGVTIIAKIMLTNSHSFGIKNTLFIEFVLKMQ